MSISLLKTSVFIVFVLLQAKALGGQSQSIQMVAGLSKPPFIMTETKQGMQIEMIKAALAISNYSVSFIHLPLNLHMGVYKRRHLDGIATLSSTESELGMYLSKPYINYQNVVVTLAKNNFQITGLSDLSGLRVAAFQNASKFLNDEYSDTVKRSVSYIELAEQKSQLTLLFNDRVDAVVMDINIFKYLQAGLQSGSNNTNIYNENVIYHPLFKPRDYVAGFKSKELKELFDKGIIEIKATGQYQKIVDRYLNPKQL